MKYRIEVKRSAAKALKKISKPDQKRISKAIDNLAENLPNPDTTKMKGDNPFYKNGSEIIGLFMKFKMISY